MIPSILTASNSSNPTLSHPKIYTLLLNLITTLTSLEKLVNKNLFILTIDAILVESIQLLVLEFIALIHNAKMIQICVKAVIRSMGMSTKTALNLSERVYNIGLIRI